MSRGVLTPPTAPHPQASSRQHLPALDLVRVMAMAAVIAIHTLAWAGRDTPSAAQWYRALDVLARMGVPCFVLLTGVVLAHASRGRRPAPWAFLRQRLVRIGVPWLVWALVWSAVWLVAVPLAQGVGLASPAEVALSLAQGPGYLYFLLLILQFSVIFLAFPTSPRGRAWVAAGAVVLQLVLTVGRLLLPDGPAWAAWLLADHAYEVAVFWIGFFALGVWAGSHIDALARVTPWRALLAAVVGVAGVLLLVGSFETGWWESSQLEGANSFLHPLFLPVACALSLLLYWGAAAAVRLSPGLGAWAQWWSAASFGIYLVHQYALDALGPLFQPQGVALRVSDPLPWSLPALLALYVLTLLSATWVVTGLRRSAWGLLILGEGGRIREDKD